MAAAPPPPNPPPPPLRCLSLPTKPTDKQISIIDGRKYDVEGEGEDSLERCELLANKQGQPLLAHGRSGRCGGGA